MPSIVLVETEIDPLFGGAQNRQRSGAGQDQVSVRRPLRGLQLKKETYATLSVDGVAGVPDIYNSSLAAETGGSFTSNFLLQSLSESRVEKFQAITTFGAPYGFFFGEQPRMVQCQAVLLNSADFQWSIEWWQNYETFLRGTQLTNRGLRAYLTYDDSIIEGYLTQASTSVSAQMQQQVNLTFTMWVTNQIILVDPGGKQVDSRHAASAPSTSTAEPVLEPGLVVNNAASTVDSGGSLLSTLRAGLEGLETATGRVRQSLDSAKRFLYGRDLVIPAGFEGAQQYAGKERAAGIVYVYPASVVPAAPAVSTAPFWENVDEYPLRAAGAATSFEDVASPTPPSVREAELVTEIFGGVDNMTGDPGQTKFVRTIERLSFGAASYPLEGAGISAASLTVGSVTGGIVDGYQQAAMAASTASS